MYRIALMKRSCHKKLVKYKAPCLLQRISQQLKLPIKIENYKDSLERVDENGKITRLRRECPNEDCGAGVFMASHFDRQYCGKCCLTYVFNKPEDNTCIWRRTYSTHFLIKRLELNCSPQAACSRLSLVSKSINGIFREIKSMKSNEENPVYTIDV
ncbi:hypothetical protein KUTeg_014067 [Tegillarca granosa]|uniref:Small ribosomal subunit protein eS31 domain-containing protein n=1 Tax=Tegillarca granosa TaxID=220873 RepID=A0ABQ9F105_TEGGR|nr:hypothetical protein KUTeg_014067 [Tegillarca granosa]